MRESSFGKQGKEIRNSHLIPRLCFHQVCVVNELDLTLIVSDTFPPRVLANMKLSTHQKLRSRATEKLHYYSKRKLLKVLVAQSCVTLCYPVSCSLPGSSVHWVLQARILEWVAIPISRKSSRPRDQTQVSPIAGRFFTVWATRKMKKYF